MKYQNGEIQKSNNYYIWSYYGQDLRLMLAAYSIDMLKFKIDMFLSFNKNILSQSEPRPISANTLFLTDSNFTGGKGELMPPKYKDGSFRIRKNGILEYRFMHLDKYRSVYGKSEEICWNKRTDIISNKKIVIPKEKVIAENIPKTIGELLDIHLTRKKNTKPQLSKSAIDNIERCIRLHISRNLKAQKLKTAKPYMFEDNLNDIESSRMREYTYTVFTGSLRFAKANNWIDTELWKLIEHTKHKSVSYRPLEDNEYDLLISKANKEIKRYIIAYCWTGCRRNELLSIKYKDINNNQITVWDQKTSKWKYIPIFPPLKEIIGTGEPEDNIFKNKPGWVNKSIRALCDREDIKLFDISTHNLRNTFGSVLYDAGVNLKDIQLWLGHSTLKVTQDTYTKRRRKAIDNSIKQLIDTMFSTHI